MKSARASGTGTEPKRSAFIASKRSSKDKSAPGSFVSLRTGHQLVSDFEVL